MGELLGSLAQRGLMRITAGGPSQPPVLTPSGRQAVQRLVNAHRERIAELLDGWSAEEQAQLSELVRRLSSQLLDDETRAAPPRGDGVDRRYAMAR